VTFHFVDKESGKDLTDFYSIKNRTGVEYYTPEIPGIENYRLVLDELPDNASGVLPDKDFDVTFKYEKIADDDKTKDECRVNVIYMDGSGKVVEKTTLTGNEGEEYNGSEKEFEDMTLRFVPKNANGTFTKTEINVIYSYSNDADPLKSVMVVVYIAAGLILAGCVASTIYSTNKRKKAFAESMDIDE
ncbi:MucBP domain-containing protein, partial [Ruminococcus sp.]|uniref:MucBP domain-containing protein n=1 Tax=Ruminococcus sp. TaxID=41978 RepID=UPI003868B3EC